MELQSVQLKRVPRIVDSPSVVFDSDEGIPGQYVVLCSCETWSNRRTLTTPTPTMRSVLFLPSRPHSITSPPHVSEILVYTQAEELTKVYNLHIFNTTFEFVKMLALSTGHLLDVGLLPVLLLFPPLAYSRFLITSPGGLNLDHPQSSFLMYVGVLESGRWRELGVAGLKTERWCWR